MDLSKLLGILAAIGQALNFALVTLGQWKPQYAVWIAGVLAAVQAFTKSIADRVTPEN